MGGGVPEPANPDQNLEKPKDPKVKKPKAENAKLSKNLQFSSLIFEYFQQLPNFK